MKFNIGRPTSNRQRQVKSRYRGMARHSINIEWHRGWPDIPSASRAYTDVELPSHGDKIDT